MSGIQKRGFHLQKSQYIAISASIPRLFYYKKSKNRILLGFPRCQTFSGSISDKNARFLAPTFGKNAPLNALSSLDFVLYFTKNSEA